MMVLVSAVLPANDPSASIPAHADARPAYESVLRWLLMATAMLVVGAVSIRTVVSFLTDGDIEHTSGTLIAIAADLRDGTLYRPISSDIGFGGTRYAPLYPAIQAGLLKWGMGYTASGFAMGLVSIITLLWGSYLLMRRLGVEPFIAGTFTCFILAASAVNTTIAGNKADLLAASLNVWGLIALLKWHGHPAHALSSTGGPPVACAFSPSPGNLGEGGGEGDFERRVAHNSKSPSPSPRNTGRGDLLNRLSPMLLGTEVHGRAARATRTQGRACLEPVERDASATTFAILATVCFILAACTKITSIFGLFAGLIWLWRRGHRRGAAFLATAFIVGIALAIIVTQIASSGRAIPVFAACAGGGGGMGQLLSASLYFLANSIEFDKTAVYLWLVALAAFVLNRKRLIFLPALLLMITSLGTIAIFGTPGANINHLVELDAASIIFLAAHWQALRFRVPLAAVVIVVLTIKWIGCLEQARELWRDPVSRQMADALADANRSPAHGPLLSENPLLALQTGEKPYLLDSFMLRVLIAKQPRVAARFWDDLANRHFRAVILSHPPTWEKMYDEYDFGPQFLPRLNESYELKSRHGVYFVYYPRPSR